MIGDCLLFSLRIELLKTLWLLMARRVKEGLHDDDEYMLNIMQLGEI